MRPMPTLRYCHCVKLVIQIPAWNEEEHVGEALDALPQEIEGFDEVTTLVIDDGSEDRTVEVAREHGADVVRVPVHHALPCLAESVRVQWSLQHAVRLLEVHP